MVIEDDGKDTAEIFRRMHEVDVNSAIAKCLEAAGANIVFMNTECFV